MKNWTWAWLCAIGLAAASPAWADDDDDIVPGQVTVKLVPGVSPAVFIAKYGVVLVDAIVSRRTYLIGVPVGDEEEFVDLIEDDPLVERAEPNYTGRDVLPDPSGQSIFVAGTAEEFARQGAIAVLGADQAQLHSTGKGVTIAVIDSGADVSHPMLRRAILPGGWNFIGENGDLSDVGDGIDSDDDGLIDEMVGHGTLVAGLIARIAPGARILPLKVLDSDGYTTTFRVVEAMYYAIDFGAPILNISLGTTQETFVIEEAMAEARAKGILVVAASGNDDTSSPVRYPAAASGDSVLAVAGLTSTSEKAKFSNFGPHISISAPAEDVTSAAPGGLFGKADGTSFSTPMVAATGALVWSRFPTLDAAEVAERIRARSRSVEAMNPNYPGQLGSGRLFTLGAVFP